MFEQWGLGFMQPKVLWFLLVVPVLLGIYLIWTLAKHQKRVKKKTDLDMVFPKRAAWKRHIAVVAAVLALASLCVAAAKPNGYVMVPKDRATVFLVIDVSLSMEATDVKPTRLQAAQVAAKDFVNELPAGFNVSIITFSATASVLVPPTTDRGKAIAAIDAIKLAPSTAIGEGIYAALNALTLIPPDPDHPNDPAPAAIVLISDGESNTGRKSAQAATDSGKLGIPIFTIAYGTANGYIIDDKGNKNPVGVSKEELRKVADLSGGKAYVADSLDKLNEVYEGISRSIGYEQQKDEITEKFVGVGVGLSVIALMAVMSLAARWP